MRMRNSLTIPADEVERMIADGTPYVVRFKIEPGRDVTVDDLLRGKVTINSSVLDDKVLYKSADDLPTYHLANIVDDHLMEVTHVIRGEEWLPSAPLHVLLYEAFGWKDTAPQFVHLPCSSNPTAKASSANAMATASASRCSSPVMTLDLRHLHRLPRERISARGRGQLPGAARMESRRRPRDNDHGGAGSNRLHSTTAHAPAHASTSRKENGLTTNICR